MLENCLRNEPQGASQTTSSSREFGRSTHLLRTALTDTPASAPEEYHQNTNIFPRLIELAEAARESWRAATFDSRLRRLLSDFKVPAALSQEVFPPGTAVSFYRERTGTRVRVISMRSRRGTRLLCLVPTVPTRMGLECGVR